MASLVVLALPILGGLYLHFSDYFELRVDKQIDNKLRQSVEKIDTKVQTTNDKLDVLGQRVAKIEGRLEGLQIQNLSMQPNKRANKAGLGDFEHTKKEGTSLDPKVIRVAGQEFISAGVSSSDPRMSRKTGLAFLDLSLTLKCRPEPLPLTQFFLRKVRIPLEIQVQCRPTT